MQPYPAVYLGEDGMFWVQFEPESKCFLINQYGYVQQCAALTDVEKVKENCQNVKLTSKEYESLSRAFINVQKVMERIAKKYE